VAKKKVEPKEEEAEDIEDFDDDEVIESHYPDVGKNEKFSSDDSPVNEELDTDEFIEGEEPEFEIEEEARFPEYKYLDLDLQQGLSENDYKLIVEGQSHGLCNIFVKHLLDIEGVKLASYKVTKISPAEIFIRIEEGYKIKDVLYKGIETLRTEVKGVQELFKKLK